jgi:hypothetical protein
MEKVPDINTQLSQFVEIHDLVRDNMKKLKYYKDQKKQLENLIIKTLVLYDKNIVDVNNKRIYHFKNPDRLTVYHPRTMKEIK